MTETLAYQAVNYDDFLTKIPALSDKLYFDLALQEKGTSFPCTTDGDRILGREALRETLVRLKTETEAEAILISLSMTNAGRYLDTGHYKVLLKETLMETPPLTPPAGATGDFMQLVTLDKTSLILYINNLQHNANLEAFKKETEIAALKKDLQLSQEVIRSLEKANEELEEENEAWEVKKKEADKIRAVSDTTKSVLNGLTEFVKENKLEPFVGPILGTKLAKWMDVSDKDLSKLAGLWGGGGNALAGLPPEMTPILQQFSSFDPESQKAFLHIVKTLMSYEQAEVFAFIWFLNQVENGQENWRGMMEVMQMFQYQRNEQLRQKQEEERIRLEKEAAERMKGRNPEDQGEGEAA